MGLFGKLFEKKECSICGGEIGLLGNRKLEDGNLCKKCNAKLSPFFEERRRTTVEGIQEHLNYREENKNALKDFHPTRTFSPTYKKMYVDEAARTFVVSGSRDWREDNADVIPMSEIAEVRVDVNEYKEEIKRTIKKGDTTERVSYNPPRYKYNYNFDLRIEMNEDYPWFHRLSLDLNDSTITIEPDPNTGRFLGLLTGGFDPHINPKYCEAERLGQEITQLLMGSRYNGVNIQTAAVDPNTPQMVECPYCGSKFTPEADTKCPFCGANV